MDSKDLPASVPVANSSDKFALAQALNSISPLGFRYFDIIRGLPRSARLFTNQPTSEAVHLGLDRMNPEEVAEELLRLDDDPNEQKPRRDPNAVAAGQRPTWEIWLTVIGDEAAAIAYASWLPHIN